MSIPFFNFVGITSFVGAAGGLPTRNYGAMIITGNPLCPTGTIITFTAAQGAAGVGAWFGFASEEYARAVQYFSFISKNGTSAKLLSFWFWNNDAATDDLIYGAPPISSLAQFNAMTSGSSAQLELTMGGFTHTVTADLGSAGSLAAVATDLTTAVNAYSAGGAAWTGAVISYNSTSGAFNLVSGLAGLDATFAVTAAASHDVAGPLGWLNPGTIISQGTAAQTIVANLNQLIGISNNFGSICTTFALALTLLNTEAIANWNFTLTPNLQFIYSINVTAANASAWEAALSAIGGCTATLQSPAAEATTEFPEMIPMTVFAATDYTQPNSTQNYKYQTNFNITPSVTSQTGYNTYTALNINFYGNTENAGSTVNFYIDGSMFGPSDYPQFQNIYANEIWFKDNLATALINLLLILPEIPANPTGVAQITGTIQTVINQALNNGTISVGKTLNSTQQLYISTITGSQNAWRQVQNQGYWLNVVIQSSIVDSLTVYTAVYTLVYSKDDVIQSITGSNILI